MNTPFQNSEPNPLFLYKNKQPQKKALGRLTEQKFTLKVVYNAGRPVCPDDQREGWKNLKTDKFRCNIQYTFLILEVNINYNLSRDMVHFLSGKNFQIKTSIISSFKKKWLEKFLWHMSSNEAAILLLICKCPLQTPILIHMEKNKFLPLLVGYLKFSMDPDWFLGCL